MKRYASTIALKPEGKDKYLQEHRAVWPKVNAMMSAANIRNFSIFIRTFPNGTDYLFMYFEYQGVDYEADMEKIAADPVTQDWWDLVKPCMEPFPDREEGEWWVPMEEVCHHP